MTSKLGKADLKGKVQTVLGLIEADDLGIVLPHEHLFTDAGTWFIEPSEPDDKELAYQPISLENLGWVRSHRTSNLDNLHQADEETAISEVMRFKKAGGSTIIDLTARHNANPLGLVYVARDTGLNVIMGTAYYVESSYLPEMRMDFRTDEDIAEEFIRDITVGMSSQSRQ